ncbi:MAG: nucleotidyl transferase AbiEii/AbiGii toxin family protein [bacterium]
MAFKGGTALRRCWFDGYRFSEDLDFTLTRPVPFEKILSDLDAIFAWAANACGLQIAFDREDRHGHQNEHSSRRVPLAHRTVSPNSWIPFFWVSMARP